MIKLNKKPFNYRVFFLINDEKDCSVSSIKACFGNIKSTRGKYIHNVLTKNSNSLHCTYKCNIKLLVRYLNKLIPTKLIINNNNNYNIRIELERPRGANENLLRSEYDYNLLFLNFIRSLYFDSKKPLRDDKIFYKHLKDSLPRLKKGDDALSILIEAQDKSTPNINTLSMGDHNIHYAKYKKDITLAKARKYFLTDNNTSTMNFLKG